MTITSEVHVAGRVAPGFERVRAEFERNLLERDDLGAAFSVHLGRETLVDLWGGTADARTGARWERDTLQTIFSGSKGITVTALLKLVDRGAIELDRPVSHYWPEFAAAGKAAVTVREVVTFTGRLPGMWAPVSQDDANDPVLMAKLIAAQELENDPRADGILYGPLSAGWIVGELIRRVDGRPLDRFFREEIAGPLGLDIHYGTGPADWPRLARTTYGTNFLPQFTGFFHSDDPLTRRIWQNPQPFPDDEGVWGRPERRSALIPAINVSGTARAFSTLYGILAEDAVRPRDDAPLLLSRTTMDEARGVYARKTDRLIDVVMAYGGGGYRLRTAERPGPDGETFGHDGGGGSANQAWPRVGLGVSYVMNRLIALGPDDKRAGSLLKALAADVTDLGLMPEGRS
ncbi:serine hydrolase [Streptomyces sp. BE20]|uniref:serine hydrolase domain-containing protein n=1 Tax=Streptomyces sp. BE20 TaxID=3002525 RepID=UPI002E78DC8A|nr:serine hydrolase domain-containing protein [Streptomyces sp. BE20]MEE1827660.1 serine hydrolase [Streptomyces sp. BE20]